MHGKHGLVRRAAASGGTAQGSSARHHRLHIVYNKVVYNAGVRQLCGQMGYVSAYLKLGLDARTTALTACGVAMSIAPAPRGAAVIAVLLLTAKQARKQTRELCRPKPAARRDKICAAVTRGLIATYCALSASTSR